MQRRPSRELLDDDAGTPSEIAESIVDLHSINRRFGGISTSLAMIEEIADKSGKRDLSLLDVGAGNGDLPATLRAQLQSRGIRLHLALLDRVYSHLGNGAACIVGDALNLPFSDNSFDIVTCNLFLHHLTPAEVVNFGHEALRCSRIAVAINDLIRSPLHLALVYAGLPLFHSRITRHDAPASVRQAYTPAEIRGLFSQTKAAQVDIMKHYLYRMGIVAWKRALSRAG
jgi:2-polyprenyl-3-methyl-5-hydroxy-6-metoxy-1,4-benzoquinol methylase